ncbi:DinB family protein [Flagellimonas sp. HMM57]|uniref:DinB family protein n=1 Tax=unclassified Flagellimonas TaxID=2644544 RepID=UPI0013D6305F|nr:MULTISPECIES: DinB family protein [unclassified Flagellimonas]UII75938.1 DinB family protein [Flagellimonas sp. HMM57]
MLSSDLPISEYDSYYHSYIQALGDAPLMDEIEDGQSKFLSFVNDIAEDKLHYAYAEGKWTVSEVLMHIVDTERIFQYRALRFARNDGTPLAGFDQNDFVPESNAMAKSREEILTEYAAVRAATIALFKSFDEALLKRMGMASGSQMSVRAMGFIICGHQAHHLKVIRNRYL